MNQKNTNLEKNYDEKGDKKPNENVGFYLSSHILIFDPKTKEVFVQKRGDF